MFYTSLLGDQKQQNKCAWTRVISSLPALPETAACHSNAAVKHLGEYGYDEPENVSSAFT